MIFSSNSKVGFSLLELVVVVGLIAAMSSVIVFSDDGNREKYKLQATIGVLEVAIQEAGLVSRAHQENLAPGAGTHLVFEALQGSLGIYQDIGTGMGGVLGVYDEGRDVLINEYKLPKNVTWEYCSDFGDLCSEVAEPMVVSWIYDNPQVTLWLGRTRILGASPNPLGPSGPSGPSNMHGRFLVKDSAINFTINDLANLIYSPE